jgi:hypothetical protein
MLKPELPASPLTRIEIEVSDTLLAALQKAPPGNAPLSAAERLEIAILTFATARALWANKRASRS